MKVLVNVTQPALGSAQEWTPCQGIKLVELADRSFDLCVTQDIGVAREQDARARGLRTRVDALTQPPSPASAQGRP